MICTLCKGECGPCVVCEDMPKRAHGLGCHNEICKGKIIEEEMQFSKV